MTDSALPEDLTIPPNEVQTLIGKTAIYVNKNGTIFETKIRTKESNNSKFLFLNSNDPYHPYYQYCLETLKTTGKLPVINKVEEHGHKKVEEASTVEKIKEAKKPLSKPKDFKFLTLENNQPVYLEDKIPKEDLKVIKLVAQFEVINGSDIFNNFKEYVLNNNKLSKQFQFLNDQHSLHKLYEKYLQIYKLIWNDNATLMGEFSNKLDRIEFLNNCFNNAEYYEKEDLDTNKIQEQILLEKIKYGSIDWQDFEVVETIEFTTLDEIAELNKPFNKSDLEYRSLVRRGESSIFDEMEKENEYYDNEENVEEQAEEGENDEEGIPEYAEDSNSENEENKDNEGNTQHTEEEVIPSQKIPKGIKIRSAGESRLLKRRYQQTKEDVSVDPATKEKLLRCPLTNELVPESKFQTHINTLLRDPKYAEERQRYEDKFKYGSGLNTQDVYENITNLIKDKKRSKNL